MAKGRQQGGDSEVGFDPEPGVVAPVGRGWSGNDSETETGTGSGTGTGTGTGTGYDTPVPRVQPGLHVLLEAPELIGGRRWALLANHSAVTVDLEPARVALCAAGVGTLVRLLAPEHGLDGVAQDMEAVDDERDPLTGVPVRSLYGRDASTLEPRPEDLEGIEVVLVDLPDIGARHYTFAATMDAVMGTCERQAVEVVVLDRPNPINGVAREGGLVSPGYESLVSRLPTPVRHGLTLGELALLLQRERYPRLELTVVACRGWRRAEWWDSTGLPWVPPSPNLPTLDTAALYPGMCLVEATNLSEGRGTTRPFHLIGAPWLDRQIVVAGLRGAGLPGVGFRPARFRPMFGKHTGEVCEGVEVHLLDRAAALPVATGLRLLQVVHDAYPAHFAWRAEPYEFVRSTPAIDLLTGSAEARACIEAGGDLGAMLDRWCQEVADFEGRLQGIELYR